LEQVKDFLLSGVIRLSDSEAGSETAKSPTPSQYAVHFFSHISTAKGEVTKEDFEQMKEDLSAE